MKPVRALSLLRRSCISLPPPIPPLLHLERSFGGTSTQDEDDTDQDKHHWESEGSLFVGTIGLASLAERQIQEAMKTGSLDNLKGKGKPLPREDHTSQFFKVDPLMSALTRSMGAQNVRPQSLELRDELQRSLHYLEDLIKRELEKYHNTASLKIVPHIRSSKGIQQALRDHNKVLRQYNGAVLQDKELFGAFWPLDVKKSVDVDQVIKKVQEASMHGQEGGSMGHCNDEDPLHRS